MATIGQPGRRSKGIAVLLGLLALALLMGGMMIFEGYLRPDAVRVTSQELNRHPRLGELLDSMQFYAGTLHNHSRYSDGLLTAEQALWWARSVAGYDFYALTDHAHLITPAAWEQTGRLTAAYTEPGRFVALRGFEWGENHSAVNPAGHVNVYDTDDYVTTATMPAVDDLYAWIADHNGLAQFNHPKHPIPYAEIAATQAFGIETGNKHYDNRSNRYAPMYQRALDDGWHVAPVYGQDCHAIPIFPYRTVLIAPELSPPALLEALRARRAYATDDPTLRIVFKQGEHWMGSVVPTTADHVVLTIFLESRHVIAEVQIRTRQGACVQRLRVNATSLLWEPVLAVDTDTFFYVTVQTARTWLKKSATIAITAPIRIRKHD